MLDLGAPGASCDRFSITYSRLRFLFPLGGQIGFSKRLIMTLFSHARKKYNRWCLLSLENNSRHTNDGAKTLTIKKLKSVYYVLFQTTKNESEVSIMTSENPIFRVLAIQTFSCILLLFGIKLSSQASHNNLSCINIFIINNL